MNFQVGLLALLLGFQAQASLVLELSGSSISDSISSNSAASNNESLVFGAAYFEVYKTLWAGWSYLSIYQSESGGAKETFQTADTGPAIKYFIGKSEIFSVFGGYGVLAQGSFQSGSSSSTWSGTSLYGGVEVLPEIGSGWRAGVNLMSYTGTYTSSTTNKVQTNTGNSKTLLLPTMVITKQW